jgi:1-acyl-sn-glycerol-3-phosphate acyltransferase
VTVRSTRRSIRPVDDGSFSLRWRVILFLSHPIVHLLFRVRTTGLEHVPSTGGAILAFNHVSVLDGPAMGFEALHGVRRPIRFLVAAEIFDTPPWGWIVRAYGQIPVRRGAGDVGAVDAAMRSVRDGAILALAPEGRVDDDAGEHGLQRLKSGVGRIGLGTGTPVIPVGIWGTQRRWPRSGLSWARPLRPRLGLAFGPPILPAGDPEDQRDLEAFRDRLRLRLEEQVTEAKRLAEGSG